MERIDCESEQAGHYPQVVRCRSHVFRADVGTTSGSSDSAPSPHDYFDAALASCKALTAIWYAKRNSLPLERVETHLERDDSEERRGIYKLRLRIEFHGDLSEEQRAALGRAVGACPIHKLMATTDVQIETLP
jgi:putative redox protein